MQESKDNIKIVNLFDLCVGRPLNNMIWLFKAYNRLLSMEITKEGHKEKL